MRYDKKIIIGNKDRIKFLSNEYYNTFIEIIDLLNSFNDYYARPVEDGKITIVSKNELIEEIDRLLKENESSIDSFPENLLILLNNLKNQLRGIFYSTRAPEAVGSYPHARWVGNQFILSGVGPRKKGSKDIPGVKLDSDNNIIDYNIEEQCKSVFYNIRVILEDAGLSWHNIVDVTSYLTNMKADFQMYNKLYKEYFGSIKPTRTTIEINSLPTPIAIELKVVAYKE